MLQNRAGRANNTNILMKKKKNQITLGFSQYSAPLHYWLKNLSALM